MFNSAVNPFAYALINQRFREKIKRMICCPTRVYVAREPQGIEMTNGIAQLPTCRPTQQDWVPHGLSRWRQIKCQHGFVNPFDTVSSQVISHNSNNSTDRGINIKFSTSEKKKHRYLGVMEAHQNCLLFNLDLMDRASTVNALTRQNIKLLKREFLSKFFSLRRTYGYFNWPTNLYGVTILLDSACGSSCRCRNS